MGALVPPRTPRIKILTILETLRYLENGVLEKFLLLQKLAQFSGAKHMCAPGGSSPKSLRTERKNRRMTETKGANTTHIFG